MELIEELKRSSQPDVIHTAQVLHDMAISFTPWLQSMIRELLADKEETSVEVPLLYDGSVRGVPAVNPMASAMIIHQNDVDLEERLYSLLEEASVEERYNHL